jgi:predicted patatin/cPLA2 family phospholipase
MKNTVAEQLAFSESTAALVVQGGGMRGIYSMGALSALEDRGLSNAFTSVTGSSAGAINAAYLLAGQANAAVNVYVDELSNRNFVNPLRVTRMVDIDFMVDVALKQRCPLDVAAVRASSTRLNIVLTDAETAQPVVVDGRDERYDIYELFRATAALPGLYGKRISIDGRDYVDGAVVDAIPAEVVREASHDLVIAILTRPIGFRYPKAGLYKDFRKLVAGRQSEAMCAAIGSADDRFNSVMELLEQGLPGRRTVWPSDPELLVGRTTTDRGKLRACAELGRADMLAVLDSPTC